MALLAILETRARPEALDELAGVMQELVQDTRRFDGCLELTIYRGEDDPTFIVFVERWVSKDHHERYVSWRRERGDADAFTRLCIGPPTVRYFVELETTERPSVPGVAVSPGRSDRVSDELPFD